MIFFMAQLDDNEKIRRTVGAVLLVVGSLCAIWGDQTNNPSLLKFGKTTAVVGIVLYFLRRIANVLRRN